jgi:hypothetical protein
MLLQVTVYVEHCYFSIVLLYLSDCQALALSFHLLSATASFNAFKSGIPRLALE